MRVVGWCSKLQDLNLGEPEEGVLGRGFMPFEERFMGLGYTSKERFMRLGYTSKESFCKKVGWVLGDQKRISLGNQRLRDGSLLCLDSKVGK